MNIKTQEPLHMNENARPKLTIGKQIFVQQLDNTFWNLPRDCFIIEMNDVYLKSNIAKQLEWNYDATVNTRKINVNTYAGKVDYNGDTYNINPGSFCSNINIKYIKEDISQYI